jgi:predicted NAD/FAD-binding protein
MERQRIAIIGSGISGLACAWFLRHEHEVHLFEKENRVGGHTHTISIAEGDREITLDTGFMVYNEVTYPLLTRLFRELDVETKPTSMSFSVQQKEAGVEFNGGSLNLLFAQRRNLFRPRFWKMLGRIARFNRETVKELSQPEYGDLSLREYVKARGYGDDFYQWYLSPMAAAVWSSPPREIDHFPAATLMRFWHNHGFLGLDTQHPWRTVTGGSQQYVRKILACPEIQVHRGNPLVATSRHPDGTHQLTFEEGDAAVFDKVILAAHGDQSNRLLADPSPLETEILSAFRYQKNEAVVHSDASVMPERKRCWASWNYRVERSPDSGEPRHSTHYWMNSLQAVSDRKNYFVSINPSSEPAAGTVHRRIPCEHPLFDRDAVRMQARLPELLTQSEHSGRYFCGAWQRNGFHEDGLWSAFNLCTSILGKEPWS